MIVAILFDKHFWTIPKAEAYLKLHQFKPIKEVHITDNYYRYRLLTPNKNNKFFTKKLNNGISLIISYK